MATMDPGRRSFSAFPSGAGWNGVTGRKDIWYLRVAVAMGPGALPKCLWWPKAIPSSIWVALNHKAWWLAFIVKLSPAGTPSIVFASSGAIYALHRVQTRSGNFILAAGVNNEYDLASLAILA